MVIEMDEVNEFAVKQGLVLLAGFLTFILCNLIIAFSFPKYRLTMGHFIFALFEPLIVFVIGSIWIRRKG